MQRFLAFALVLGLSTLPGCADSKAPTTPDSSSLNIAGTWNGSMTVGDNQAGMTWTLAQSETALSGPVTLALASGIVLMNGTFTGTLTGSSLAGTVAVTPGGIPVYPACTGQLSATMNVTLGTVSTLSGPVSLVTSTCTVPFTSSVVTLARP
jgi:hypothetical protein